MWCVNQDRVYHQDENKRKGQVLLVAGERSATTDHRAVFFLFPCSFFVFPNFPNFPNFPLLLLCGTIFYFPGPRAQTGPEREERKEGNTAWTVKCEVCRGKREKGREQCTSHTHTHQHRYHRTQESNIYILGSSIISHNISYHV